MVTRLFLFFLTFFMSAVAYAQENYQPSYYLNNQRDTVKGYIDYQEWLRNPSSFQFKKDINQSDPETLDKRQFIYISIANEVVYERAYVAISQNEVRLSQQLTFEKSKSDTILLEIIQKGDVVNLYYYKDDIKTRYYIKESDNAPYELEYEVDHYSKPPRINEKFKKQLYALASKKGKLTSDLEWRLKKSSYGSKSLLTLVSHLNGLDYKKAIKKSANPKSIMRLYVGGGLNKSDLIYDGGPQWSKSSSSSYAPYLAIGLDYRSNATVGRYSVQGEISFSSASIQTVATGSPVGVPMRIDYDLTQFTSNLSILVNYDFYRTNKLNFFAGGGVRAIFSSYSTNSYTITTFNTNGTSVSSIPDFFELKSRYYSFVVRAGVQLGKKLECAIEYNPSLAAKINNYDGLWSETMVTQRVGVNYFFGLKAKSKKAQ